MAARLQLLAVLALITVQGHVLGPTPTHFCECVNTIFFFDAQAVRKGLAPAFAVQNLK